MLALCAIAGLWGCKNMLPGIAPVSSGAGSPAVRAQLDGVARLAGFGIDMVVLTGHRFTADSDIFDALDLPNARSLMSFDTEGVRRRLERLPWILSAELTRVFPDRLDVRVSERKAFAVWMRDGHAQLIDKTGRVLSAVNRADGLDLPKVSGEGAPQEAQPLLTLLARCPDIWARLEVAERVAGRRWTLHLSRGIAVHLPADREAAVLETLTAGGGLANILDTGNRIVDLRASGRVAIRDVASPRRTESNKLPAGPSLVPDQG